MVIFFNVKQAREFLLSHGHVYTLRTRFPKLNRTIDSARWGSFYKFQDLGRVRVSLTAVVKDPSELQPYVAESGFHTVRGWIEAAEPNARFLLKVSRLGV